MMSIPSKAPEPAKAPALLAFVCPACAAPNEVGLVALSRSGATKCTSCNRGLRVADVMRARHSPRRTA